MNDSYQDNITGGLRKMLDENEINGTSSVSITTISNDTLTREIENFDVSGYLASILGPQRQPSEKVY